MKIEVKNGLIYIDEALETDPTLIGFYLLDLAEELKEGTVYEATL